MKMRIAAALLLSLLPAGWGESPETEVQPVVIGLESSSELFSIPASRKDGMLDGLVIEVRKKEGENAPGPVRLFPWCRWIASRSGEEKAPRRATLLRNEEFRIDGSAANYFVLRLDYANRPSAMKSCLAVIKGDKIYLCLVAEDYSGDRSAREARVRKNREVLTSEVPNILGHAG